MSLHHMILGCLMDAPSHGYEIRKRVKELFQRSHDVNESQLYAALRKMEGEGLVRKEVVLQDKTPPRNVFYLTEKGAEEVFTWLIKGDELEDTYRFDFYQAFRFLERYNYFKHLPKDTAMEILEKQIVFEQGKLEEFKRVRNNMQALKLNQFRIGIIEFGLAFQKTKLEWLESMKSSLINDREL
ncbi:MAG: PadR family transcriptional regulator [Syntrophomonas sp.]